MLFWLYAGPGHHIARIDARSDSRDRHRRPERIRRTEWRSLERPCVLYDYDSASSHPGVILDRHALD